MPQRIKFAIYQTRWRSQSCGIIHKVVISNFYLVSRVSRYQMAGLNCSLRGEEKLVSSISVRCWSTLLLVYHETQNYRLVIPDAKTFRFLKQNEYDFYLKNYNVFRSSVKIFLKKISTKICIAKVENFFKKFVNLTSFLRPTSFAVTVGNFSSSETATYFCGRWLWNPRFRNPSLGL